MALPPYSVISIILNPDNIVIKGIRDEQDLTADYQIVEATPEEKKEHFVAGDDSQAVVTFHTYYFTDVGSSAVWAALKGYTPSLLITCWTHVKALTAQHSTDFEALVRRALLSKKHDWTPLYDQFYAAVIPTYFPEPDKAPTQSQEPELH